MPPPCRRLLTEPGLRGTGASGAWTQVPQPGQAGAYARLVTEPHTTPPTSGPAGMVRRLVDSGRLWLGDIRLWLGARTRPSSLLGRGVFLAVVASLCLIPSSWGFMPGFGMSVDTRAQLGSALATGAILAAIVAIAERHRHDEDRRTRRALAIHPLDTAVRQLLADLAVDTVGRVLRRGRALQNPGGLPVGGAGPSWDSAHLQTVGFYGGFLFSAALPARSPEHARVYLTALHIFLTLNSPAEISEDARRAQGFDDQSNSTKRATSALQLRRVVELGTVAAAQLRSDSDSDTARVQALLDDLFRFTPTAGIDDDNTLGVATSLCRYLHPTASLDPTGDASRARPHGVEVQSATLQWWEDPQPLIDWVQDATGTLAAGRDVATLFPTNVHHFPMSVDYSDFIDRVSDVPPAAGHAGTSSAGRGDTPAAGETGEGTATGGTT